MTNPACAPVTRTYTYTVADYREVFGEAQHGFVGVDPDGDLVWARRSDIVWAHESVVLSYMALSDWGTDGDLVVFAPSAMQRADFEARR